MALCTVEERPQNVPVSGIRITGGRAGAPQHRGSDEEQNAADHVSRLL
jgi:hypothetical protein